MELSDSITEQLRSNAQVVAHSQQTVPLAGGVQGIRVYVADDPGGIPDRIEGLPVEVEVVGRNEFQRATGGMQLRVNPRQKTRPVIGGVSVGGTDTGTLGYFVHVDGHLSLMTAAHVLGGVGGEAIQPGPDDGGTGADRVATVVRTVDNPAEGVDAAAARLDSGIKHELKLNDIGKVTGTATVIAQQTVRKSGRTSGVTSAKVHEIDVAVQYDGVWYQHQIVVHRFSEGGDSGSLVVDASDQAIGLVMGANATYSHVNPIGRVLQQLNATLAV